MKKLQKGFTLIELLVVIAIIGILSSVVLASLTSARSKGTDAAIQSAMSNMRAQAELLYANANSYGPDLAITTCPTSGHSIFATTTTGGLKNLVADVEAKNGTAANTFCVSEDNPAAWAVIASTTSGSWCVDSTGASKASTGVTGQACN